jgi:hypothetical protein
MSITTQPDSLPPLSLELLRPSELGAGGEGHRSWLWDGYLAPGKVTALVSAPKIGKTTLVARLLARTEKGGELAGLRVAPARVIVVSEEAKADWDARCRQLGIGQNVRFVCRPFQGARPTDRQWFALIAGLQAAHRQEPVDLIVLDALATLLPGYAETCAPKLLDCLLPLQALAHAGPAVWLMHHPAKGQRADGQSARGSGALAGLADIIMEMTGMRRARSRDRRRRICAYSRYVDTPRHRVIELTADATDYLVHTDAAGTPLAQPWGEVQHLLSQATCKLSQEAILARWPAEDGAPERSTLSRWLKRATAQGVICCSGSGYRGDPFVYWLPGREPLLWPGDNASDEAKQSWRDRLAAHERTLRGQGATG